MNDAQHDEPIASGRALVAVWLALLCATAVTVWVSALPLGRLRVWIALAIAAGKSALVLTFFMRLRYEPRFFAIMVLIAVATLAVFIGLTFFDVPFR